MSIESAIAELAPHFGERLGRGESVREQHSRGESWQAAHLPDAVIWPRSTEEVSLVARTCNAHGCPIVAWGAGTSLEGHAIPVQGGISLDFGQMDKVLAIHQEDMDVVVQPGITRKRAERGAARHRAVLSHRPRRRRLDRRHDRHARLGHLRRALRHDARVGAGARGRSGRRAGDPHRHAGAEILGRLRPDAALRRLGGDAGDHHRDHAAALRPARGGGGGDLHLPDDGGCGQHGDRDDPDGRADRPDGVRRRAVDQGRQRVRQLLDGRAADAVHGVSWHRGRRRRAVRDGARDRVRPQRLGVRVDDQGRGPQPAVVRPGTTTITR